MFQSKIKDLVYFRTGMNGTCATRVTEVQHKCMGGTRTTQVRHDFDFDNNTGENVSFQCQNFVTAKTISKSYTLYCCCKWSCTLKTSF